MTVTREDLNQCTVKLSIVCEPAEVKEGFEKAYRQFAKHIRVPGFRPGHAPKAMIEPMINQQGLFEEAADQIVRKAIDRAIQQEKLQRDPSQRPMVDLTKFERDSNECEFTVKIGMSPIVEIGEYKGLPVEKPAVDVTDEEIDHQIEELRMRKSTRQAITDRGVEDGDIAVLNVKVDGEAGDGRTFMTVAGKTFPQLDEAIRGMKVEEMKHVELSFPDNFQEKDWQGKTLPSIVTVNSLSAVRLPELDEAFAQSLKTNDVSELRDSVRGMISRAKEDMVRDVVSEQLLDRLLERSTVHVPDNMWENLAIQRIRETEAEQQSKGKTLEDHAKENGMTVEQVIEYWKEKAQIHVKRALLIREVFGREKMGLTDQELNRELFLMAREYEITPDELVAILRKNNQFEELHFRAIARKVGDYLAEHANETQAAPA